MNKKKRALALGLAATQLTALSAIVAPLTAFAEITSPIATNATSLNNEAGTVEYVSAKNLIKYEINDFSQLSQTPSEPSYQSLGVKIAAANGKNDDGKNYLAFGNSTYGPDSQTEIDANIKNDGFVFWLSGKKSAEMKIALRKYENEVTLSNGQFVTTIDGKANTAITEGTSEFKFKDGVGTSGTEYKEETWTIVRVRNMTATLDASSLTSKYEDDDAAIAALEALTPEFSEYEATLATQPEKGDDTDGKDYTISAEKKANTEVDSDGKTTFTVTITLNADDARMEFDDSVTAASGDSAHKTATFDVKLSVKEAAEEVEANAEFKSGKVDSDGKLVLASGTKVEAADEAALITAAKTALGTLTDLVDVKTVVASGETATTLTADSDFTVSIATKADGTTLDTETVKDADDAVTGIKFKLVVTLNGDYVFSKTEGTTEAVKTKELTVTVPASIKEAPKAVVNFTAPTNATVTVKNGTETVTSDTSAVKNGDTLTVTVTPDEGYELSSNFDVKSALGGGSATNATKNSDGTYTITVSGIADGNSDKLNITFVGTVKAIPTATVTKATLDHATVDVKDADGKAVTKVKTGDKLVVAVTPEEGYELPDDFKVQYALGSATADDATLKNGKYEITVGTIPDNNTDEFKITFSVAVKKSADVDFVALHHGKSDAPTMVGNANLTNYQYNLLDDRYDFKFNDAKTELTITAKYGAMKGETTAGPGGKNVLVVFEMKEKDDKLEVYQNDTKITDTSWMSDGYTFVQGGEATKGYVTLWISLTDARMNGTDTLTYTFQSGKVNKEFTVKFVDNTEYKLTAPALAANAKYEINVTNPAAGSSEATVTVAPKDDGVITEAKVAGVTLTPNGKNYTGKVDIKDLLTEAEIKAGKTEVALTEGDGTATTVKVTVAARSDIDATTIAAAVEEPSSMTGDTAGLARYKNNRALYAKNITWDGTSKTATVKVPSALMDGTATGDSTGANVCLVMTFATALTKGTDNGTDGAWGLKATGIEDIDVEDGWRFVQGATEADKGKYAVLWINAHSTKFTNGNKVVIYNDKDGKVIATVNLENVPSVKAASATLTATANLTGVEAANQAKTITDAALGAITSNADEKALLECEAVTVPTETGDVNVVVKAKTGNVLADSTGKVVESLTVKVTVTVPAATKYAVTLDADTNATVTGLENNDEFAKDAKVEFTVTTTTGFSVKKVSWKTATGAATELTAGADGKYSFTMPGEAVTVTVETEAAAKEYTITAEGISHGTVIFKVDGKTVTTAKKGDTVTVEAKADSNYTVGDITVDGTKITGTTFVMPEKDVTVTVAFNANSSGGSSSGGSHSGGSSGSRPSGGSTVNPSKVITDADKGTSVSMPTGTAGLLGDMLSSAAEKDLTVSVPVSSTFEWEFKPSEMEDTKTILNLRITESDVTKAQVASVPGKAITETPIAFETAKMRDLGDSATLTVRTSVRPTAAKPMFANLYKEDANGKLVFAGVAPIGADGRAKLPVSEGGKYVVLISEETKLTGDMNNDCTVDVDDVLATINRILNHSYDSRWKSDLVNDGLYDVDDVMALIKLILNTPAKK